MISEIYADFLSAYFWDFVAKRSSYHVIYAVATGKLSCMGVCTLLQVACASDHLNHGGSELEEVFPQACFAGLPHPKEELESN